MSTLCFLESITTRFTRAGVIFAAALVLALGPSAQATSFANLSHEARAPQNKPIDGVRFDCTSKQLDALLPAMTKYLRLQGVADDWISVDVDRSAGTVGYVLRTAADDTDTLSLAVRPEYHIEDEVVELPDGVSAVRRVRTVSQKEIVLALFQHGRLTEFAGRACDIQAFRDHVGVRQMTVAWAEVLEWDWPDGGPAKWNDRYWRSGTPLAGVQAHVAVRDAFVHQSQYAIGCYTASKLVMEQGVLDYYQRVKQDAKTAALLEDRLLVDGEPLVNLEPGIMWNFEQDFDPSERDRPGKLLRIQYGVAPGNFIPGDWSYFVNTDPVSYQKTGYEGSNAIYLGRNRFDDYYNDNNHSYDFKQKLDEVWQWRHGVFSRSRDVLKIVPMSEDDLRRLSLPPAAGGLLLDLRVFPYLFGYEALPPLPR